jgi:hypothetical protein
VYDDIGYEAVWLHAQERLQNAVERYVQKFGHDIPVAQYEVLFKRAVKEVLDAIMNDSVEVEDHLNIEVEADGAQMSVAVSSISSAGDAFIMIYDHDEAEQC